MYNAIVRVYEEEHFVTLANEVEVKYLVDYADTHSSFIDIITINKVKLSSMTLPELVALCEA